MLYNMKPPETNPCRHIARPYAALSFSLRARGALHGAGEESRAVVPREEEPGHAVHAAGARAQALRPHDGPVDGLRDAVHAGRCRMCAGSGRVVGARYVREG